MDVTYNKLFKLLIDKEMKKWSLQKTLVSVRIPSQNFQGMSLFLWKSSCAFAEN